MLDACRNDAPEPLIQGRITYQVEPEALAVKPVQQRTRVLFHSAPQLRSGEVQNWVTLVH
jgi:hypothetical protein